jgi:hypothetical protein
MGEHEITGTRTRDRSYAEHVEAIKHRVETARDSIERVIETEEKLREDPERRDRAEDRIIQAEREHGILEAELQALEAGDVQATTDLHEGYMRQEIALDDDR